MKMNAILVLGLFLLASGLTKTSYGNEVDVTSGETMSVTSMDATISHTQWQFLGCVHNTDPQHECEHVAHDRGYHHHTAIHSHWQCWQHDHSYACYGKN